MPHNMIVTYHEMAGANDSKCKILVLKLANQQLRPIDTVQVSLKEIQISYKFSSKLFSAVSKLIYKSIICQNFLK